MALAAAAAPSAIGGGSMVHPLTLTSGFIDWQWQWMAAVPGTNKSMERERTEKQKEEREERKGVRRKGRAGMKESCGGTYSTELHNFSLFLLRPIHAYVPVTRG